MAWDKSTLVDTHTLTQDMIDKIMSMGPRGHEWLVIAGGGSFPSPGSLIIDAALAETLLQRGPRAAHMAQVLTGAVAASLSNISSIINNGNNSFVLKGAWMPGVVVDGSFVVTDPDEQQEEYSFSVPIPAGAPEEGWDAATAASVVCAAIDDLTHIRCARTGSSLVVSVAAPSNTLSFSDLIVRG
jgi:hypothetical protein